MGLSRNTGVFAMKRFLNKLFAFLLVIFGCCAIVAENGDKRTFKEVSFEKLKYAPMSKVNDEFGFGKLVDVQHATKMYGCYIFIFKGTDGVIEVLANSERHEFVPLDEMKLDEYVALGFFRVRNLRGEILQDFFWGGNCKKYAFLDDIAPYTPISEIEKKIDLSLIKVDKGGFLFPFYNFIYGDGTHVLELICTWGDDKNDCYFLGGWSYR